MEAKFKKHETLVVISGGFRGRNGFLVKTEETDSGLLYVVKIGHEYLRFTEGQLAKAFDQK